MAKLTANAQEKEEDPIAVEAAKHAGAKRAEVLSTLAQYHPKVDAATSRKDAVEERYVIQFNQPLPDLDTSLNRAFSVVDEKDPSRALYALLCGKELPQRVSIMPQMRGMNNPNLIAPLATSVVEMPGGDQRLAIIFPRPAGRKLSTLLAEKKIPRGETYARMNIIAPLSGILQQLDDLGLCHGRINADNIFVSDTVMLGECVSEPCGYSQLHYCETPERMSCRPAGKGEGDPSVDIYAIGVLMLVMQPSRRAFTLMSPAELTEMIQVQGAYNALIGEDSFLEGILDLLRGTLHDHKRDRWSYSQVKVWVGGKKFNVLLPSFPIESSRPYVFLEVGYLNRKALAAAFFNHWNQAAAALRDGSVTRWVELSMGQKEAAAMLHRIFKNCGGDKGGVVITPKLNDELIARSLNVLDPFGPMRLRNMALHVDGMGAMLTDVFRTNNPDDFATMTEVLEYDLPNGWSDVLKRLLDILVPNNISNTIWKLDRMRMVLRSKGLGFGLERALYELNPYYPCQSPLLKGRHVTTLQQLMYALDSAAVANARDSEPMDRHIAAFIGSRMNLAKEVRIQELHNNRALGNHRALITLKLLEQAQHKIGSPKLPGLSAWVASTLFSVCEFLHSKTLRAQVESILSAYAHGGLLRPMLEIMQSPQHVAFDKSGFEEAIAHYHNNIAAIETLKNKRVLRAHAFQLGNRFSKFASYAFLGSILYYMYLANKF